MKRFLYCVGVLLCACSCAFAQTPKYAYSSYVPNKTFGGVSFTSPSNKAQCIYYPSNFPAMPSGMVNAIYLRVNSHIIYNPPPIVYNNFKLKIGYTTDSVWRSSPPGSYDTFKTGLVTVVDKPAYTFTDTAHGHWVKFPMDGNNSFYYDNTKKFVIELEQGYQPANEGFDWLGSNTVTSAKRTLPGAKDSLRTTVGGVSGVVADLGFDLVTTSVAGVSNFRIFGLEPNPAPKGGSVQIGFESAQPLDDVLITLTNVAGQQVLRRHYRAGGYRFNTELSIGDLPAGMYIVRVAAGGEAESRRLLVE